MNGCSISAPFTVCSPSWLMLCPLCMGPVSVSVSASPALCSLNDTELKDQGTHHPKNRKHKNEHTATHTHPPPTPHTTTHKHTPPPTPPTPPHTHTHTHTHTHFKPSAKTTHLLPPGGKEPSAPLDRTKTLRLKQTRWRLTY